MVFFPRQQFSVQRKHSFYWCLWLTCTYFVVHKDTEEAVLHRGVAYACSFDKETLAQVQFFYRTHINGCFWTHQASVLMKISISWKYTQSPMLSQISFQIFDRTIFQSTFKISLKKIPTFQQSKPLWKTLSFTTLLYSHRCVRTYSGLCDEAFCKNG